MPTLYELLGVPRDAKPEAIRKAYRAQAAKLHPDKNPAPEAAERFRKLKQAHDILIDPEKRRIYDETGDSELSERQPNAIVQGLQKMFLEVLSHEGVEANIIQLMVGHLKRNQKTIGNTISSLNVSLGKLKKAKERVKHTGPRNIFLEALDAQSAVLEQDIKSAQTSLGITEQMLELLKAYEYAGEEKARASQVFSGWSSLESL